MIYPTSSLIGALFAYVALKEPFTIEQTIAAGGMLCGIYLLYKA